MTASAGIVTVSSRRTGAGGVLGSLTGTRFGSVSLLPYPPDDPLPASRVAQRSSFVDPASRDGHVSGAGSSVRGALAAGAGSGVVRVTLAVLRGAGAGAS